MNNRTKNRRNPQRWLAVLGVMALFALPMPSLAQTQPADNDTTRRQVASVSETLRPSSVIS